MYTVGPALTVRISSVAQPMSVGDILALVDTGATESCIDSSVADELGLVRVDTISMSGISGQVALPVYLARIEVPALQTHMLGRFTGVHLVVGGQPYGALLGRSFLRNYTMTYEGRSGMVLIGNDVP